MKGRHTLKLVTVLALVSAGAIIGLLLAGGSWDAVLLVLAASPLAVGAWRWWVEARTTNRR
jgi:hypothetical protein